MTDDVLKEMKSWDRCYPGNLNIEWTWKRAEQEIERLRTELAAEREALLTAEMMLSELRVNASEKCQMAYDHLHRHRVGGDE